MISQKSDQLLCHAGILNEKTGLTISANFGMRSVVVCQYRNTLKLGLEQWKVESLPFGCAHEDVGRRISRSIRSSCQIKAANDTLRLKKLGFYRRPDRLP